MRMRATASIARRGVHELTTTILTADEVRDLVERMLKSSGRRVDLSTPSSRRSCDWHRSTVPLPPSRLYGRGHLERVTRVRYMSAPHSERALGPRLETRVKTDRSSRLP